MLGPPFAYNRSRVKIGPPSLASQKLLAPSLLWRRGLSKLQAAGKSAFCPTTIEFCKRVSQVLIVLFKVREGGSCFEHPLKEGAMSLTAREKGEETERLIGQSHLVRRPTSAVDSGCKDRSAPKIAFVQ